MEEIKKDDLFTLEEVAKWCNLSKHAVYMHYRRGHLTPEPLPCHRLYFKFSEVYRFKDNYTPKR